MIGTRILLSILLFFWIDRTILAQPVLQVVEKTIERKIVLSKNDNVKIAAEKAVVYLHAWPKDYGYIKIVFSAKHSIKSIAQTELDFMKYSIGREGNTVVIMNNFMIPENIEQLRSSFNTTLEVYLPERSDVVVLNKYGSTSVTGSFTEAGIVMEFGDIILNEVKGHFTLENSYGEIRAHEVSGVLNCKVQKSSIVLSSIQGNCSINSSYGNIDLELTTALTGLQIAATRTSVMVRLDNFNQFNYDLQTSYAKIYLPKSDKDPTSDRNAQERSTFKRKHDKDLAYLIINTTYSPITIKD